MGALHGSVVALVIGLVTSLLAGLGVTQAAQNAFDRVWAVPFKDRPNFLKSRLRGLILLVVLGVLFIFATLASGLVTGGLGKGWLVGVAGIVISLLLNFGTLLRHLPADDLAEIPTQDLRVGVIVAGVRGQCCSPWAASTSAMSSRVSTAPTRSSASSSRCSCGCTSGAQMTLYAAEINVVLRRRLWPRSLFGPPRRPPTSGRSGPWPRSRSAQTPSSIDVEFKA